MKGLNISKLDNCAFCEIPGSLTIYGKSCDEVADVLNKAAELKMFGLGLNVGTTKGKCYEIQQADWKI